MAVITYDDGQVVTVPSTVTTAATGHGRSKDIFSVGAAKPLKIATGTFAFDSSYPTGGEDISDIFNLFPGGAQFVLFDQPVQTGAQTGKFVRVDHTNKKVQLFTNASPYAEVANASDQSAISALRFIALGY